MPDEKTRVGLGVTGHRVLMEPEKINAGLDAALAHIKEHFPNCPFTVPSALAEETALLDSRGQSDTADDRADNVEGEVGGGDARESVRMCNYGGAPRN